VYVNTNLGIRYTKEQKKKMSLSRLGKGTGKRYRKVKHQIKRRKFYYWQSSV
ncbi:MAG: hypothetical protein UT59_C0072G0007, partial [candidate division CPR2 bacterium GW2011_GWD1_39_7]